MKNNISALTLLTILFVGLKLTKHIDWSWWWVVSPTLFQIGLTLAAVFLIFLTSFVEKECPVCTADEKCWECADDVSTGGRK